MQRARTAKGVVQQTQKQLGQLTRQHLKALEQLKDDVVQEPGIRWLKAKKIMIKTMIDTNHQEHRVPLPCRDKRPRRVSPTHARAKALTKESATAEKETSEEETPHKYSSVLYLKNAMRGHY